MKKSYLFILSLFAGMSLLTSCLPDPAEEALRYNGPAVVEFKNHTLGMLTSVLNAKGVATGAGNSQTLTSRTVLLNEREIDTVFVQLIGSQRSTAIDLAFEVDEEASTAVEGEHYRFIPNGNRTVTIPAESSRGLILIEMIPNSIPAGERRTIELDLLGNEDISATPNYDTFTVTLYNPS